MRHMTLNAEERDRDIFGPNISKTAGDKRLGYNGAPIGNGTQGISTVTFPMTLRDR